MKIIALKYDFCAKEVMGNEPVRTHFISDVPGTIPVKLLTRLIYMIFYNASKAKS